MLGVVLAEASSIGCVQSANKVRTFLAGVHRHEYGDGTTPSVTHRALTRSEEDKVARAKKDAPRADLLEAEPSQMHNDLAEYITEQTGYEADVKTVQMVTTL